MNQSIIHNILPNIKDEALERLGSEKHSASIDLCFISEHETEALQYEADSLVCGFVALV